MTGLFKNLRFPATLMAKPTGAMIEVEPIQLSPVDEPFFGGYAIDMLSDFGADPVLEMPQPRAARKVQG